MKQLSKLFQILIVSTLLWSCKKDEHRVYFEGGNAPVLTASVTDSVPLSFANAAQPAVKLSWTNPAYQFTTGVSSQDVSYLLEIDTAGSNFTNPSRRTLAIKNDLSTTITQGDFNDYLLNTLNLLPGMAHHIEMRVTASLSGSAVPIASNIVAFTATPYTIPPKVAPPASGHLYLVGDATQGGWNNPVPVPSQEFTQISPTLYEITVPLIGGKEYLFLPVNGDWSHKYAVPDKTLSGLNEGGDFKLDANDNFPGPAVSGTYKITVDFQRGRFSVTKM